MVTVLVYVCRHSQACLYVYEALVSISYACGACVSFYLDNSVQPPQIILLFFSFELMNLKIRLWVGVVHWQLTHHLL